jgi:hypothetical protein
MKKLLLAAALMLSAGTAQATIMTPGVHALTGTTVAADPSLAGTVVQDVLTPFTLTGAAGTFIGSVQSRVVLAVDGTYDFYWRIRDTQFTPIVPGTTAGLSSLRLINLGTFLYSSNGNFRIDSVGTLGPDNALVFSNPADAVNFRFSGNGLAGGTDSKFFFIDTNAHAYTRTASYDVQSDSLGTFTGLFSTFAPSGPVPEPATWAMMLTGFGLAGVALRRRRQLVQRQI